MKNLNLNQMETLQGGQCNVECSFTTPSLVRFIFLICDANQLNGWLVAAGASADNGALECHIVG